MKGHIDDGVLQDFHEGLLDEEATEEIRAHLDACPECREGLAGLTGLLEGLAGLPVEAGPPRDLWPQIAWRMEGARSGEQAPEDAEGKAVPPERDHPGSGRGRRRVSLPAWQLLAASIALMVISGGSVWAILSGRFDAGPAPVPGPVSPAQLVGWEEAYGGYDEAVADLEAVLEQGREVLDPETVRVLEENLQTIDQAIQDAEDALVQDPASPILQRFLVENLRKKVDLLRRAAGAVYAIT